MAARLLLLHVGKVVGCIMSILHTTSTAEGGSVALILTSVRLIAIWHSATGLGLIGRQAGGAPRDRNQPHIVPATSSLCVQSASALAIAYLSRSTSIVIDHRLIESFGGDHHYGFGSAEQRRQLGRRP